MKPPIVSFEVLGQAHTPSQCPHQISTPETKVAVHGEETNLTAAPAFEEKKVGMGKLMRSIFWGVKYQIMSSSEIYKANF